MVAKEAFAVTPPNLGQEQRDEFLPRGPIRRGSLSSVSLAAVGRLQGGNPEANRPEPAGRVDTVGRLAPVITLPTPEYRVSGLQPAQTEIRPDSDSQDAVVLHLPVRTPGETGFEPGSHDSLAFQAFHDRYQPAFADTEARQAASHRRRVFQGTSQAEIPTAEGETEAYQPRDAEITYLAEYRRTRLGQQPELAEPVEHQDVLHKRRIFGKIGRSLRREAHHEAVARISREGTGDSVQTILTAGSQPTYENDIMPQTAESTTTKPAFVEKAYTNTPALVTPASRAQERNERTVSNILGLSSEAERVQMLPFLPVDRPQDAEATVLKLTGRRSEPTEYAESQGSRWTPKAIYDRFRNRSSGNGRHSK